MANAGRLRKTEVGELAKSGEDLAAPITFTPFKNEDHSNKVANADRLRKTEVGEAVKSGENLAAPITNTPFKNNDREFRSSIFLSTFYSSMISLLQLPNLIHSTLPFSLLPVTLTRHTDTNYVANPNQLRTTEEGQLAKSGENLAAPVTHIRKFIKKKKKKPQQ